MDKQKSFHVAAKLSVKSHIKYIPAVASFIREMAVQSGISVKAAQRLELIAEEACLNIIRHAFEGKTDCTYDVMVEKRPSQFVLAFEDQGLPFDWEKASRGESAGFGMLFMKAFTDEVRFINLGRQGKRFEFIKNFAAGEMDVSYMDEDADHKTDIEPVGKDVTLTFRLLTADDGVRLARCMYHVYGYTYKDDVYFPEKIREMVERGELVSMVAVSPDDEIVAHQGLKKEHRDARVAEISMGIVDPRFRGRGLFEKMKKLSFEYIKGTGVYGLFVEIVTIHEFSQKANHALGARETGILLGFVPKERAFVAFDRQDNRQTVVLCYTRLAAEPERRVYLPTHHQSIIKKIYDYGGFRRIVARIPDNVMNTLPENSQVDIRMVYDTGIAYLKVVQYGRDFPALIHFRLRELCLNKVDCIFMDLPLSDPATPVFCIHLEILGFFLAGVLPEVADGDILRLEYLNNVIIDPEKIVLVSEFAKELFRYVWKCYSETSMAASQPRPAPFH